MDSDQKDKEYVFKTTSGFVDVSHKNKTINGKKVVYFDFGDDVRPSILPSFGSVMDEVDDWLWKRETECARWSVDYEGIGDDCGQNPFYFDGPEIPSDNDDDKDDIHDKKIVDIIKHYEETGDCQICLDIKKSQDIEQRKIEKQNEMLLDI